MHASTLPQMGSLERVIFLFGATDSPTHWKREGRLTKPGASLTEGPDRISDGVLTMPNGAVWGPFIHTALVTPTSPDEDEASLSARADQMFLADFPNYQLI